MDNRLRLFMGAEAARTRIWIQSGLSVAYALAITLKCKDGAADTFRRVLGEITPPSRAEPGSLAFVTHESLEEPNVFLVYESYVDEQAYEAHLATAAFARVEAELFPLVTERDVHAYTPLAG